MSRKLKHRKKHRKTLGLQIPDYPGHGDVTCCDPKQQKPCREDRQGFFVGDGTGSVGVEDHREAVEQHPHLVVLLEVELTPARGGDDGAEFRALRKGDEKRGHP